MCNVAIICKRFYALTTMKELGFTKGSNNNSRNILNKHTRLLTRFNLCAFEETKCLSMHKKLSFPL